MRIIFMFFFNSKLLHCLPVKLIWVFSGSNWGICFFSYVLQISLQVIPSILQHHLHFIQRTTVCLNSHCEQCVGIMWFFRLSAPSTQAAPFTATERNPPEWKCVYVKSDTVTLSVTEHPHGVTSHRSEWGETEGSECVCVDGCVCVGGCVCLPVCLTV